VTPVSAEGLILLQNWIIKRYAHALEDQNHIRLLLAVNDEAKVRRSTKPVVLGTKGSARVMSYAELEEAQVKRAE
ncbi:hypothetical protein GQ44DRAFT_624556, partial [Phaeosphaeriaceae sp. PMI808]